MDFKGSTVVITGGAGGIGKATAEIMGGRGADLILADISDEAAERTVSQLSEQGIGAEYVRTDLTDLSAIRSLFQQAAKRNAGVDVLVNCAGIASRTAVPDITPEEWDRIFAINLKSVFFCCQQALNIMIAKKRGKIVTVASAAAKIGGVAVGAHYSSSKAGIICLTKSLALYAAPYKINVNCVCPGPTATAMTDAWGEEINTAFAEKIPFKRYATPVEIAETIAFLASEQSGYLTGETIDVNGGLVMD
jgi:3-oxoacyl-[acyl-carrier protein] reductase